MRILADRSLAAALGRRAGPGPDLPRAPGRRRRCPQFADAYRRVRRGHAARPARRTPPGPRRAAVPAVRPARRRHGGRGGRRPRAPPTGSRCWCPASDTTLRDFDRGLGGVARRAPAVQARALYRTAARGRPGGPASRWWPGSATTRRRASAWTRPREAPGPRRGGRADRLRATALRAAAGRGGDADRAQLRRDRRRAGRAAAARGARPGRAGRARHGRARRRPTWAAPGCGRRWRRPTGSGGCPQVRLLTSATGGGRPRPGLRGAAAADRRGGRARRLPVPGLGDARTSRDDARPRPGRAHERSSMTGPPPSRRRDRGIDAAAGGRDRRGGGRALAGDRRCVLGPDGAWRHVEPADRDAGARPGELAAADARPVLLRRRLRGAPADRSARPRPRRTTEPARAAADAARLAAGASGLLLTGLSALVARARAAAFGVPAPATLRTDRGAGRQPAVVPAPLPGCCAPRPDRWSDASTARTAGGRRTGRRRGGCRRTPASRRPGRPSRPPGRSRGCSASRWPEER